MDEAEIAAERREREALVAELRTVMLETQISIAAARAATAAPAAGGDVDGAAVAAVKLEGVPETELGPEMDWFAAAVHLMMPSVKHSLAFLSDFSSLSVHLPSRQRLNALG